MILIYSLLSVLVMLIGGAIGSFLKLGSKSIRLVQHLTAGIIFGAVATELLPKILEVHSPFHTAMGFSFGVILMVGIKTLSTYVEAGTQSSVGLLFGVGIDLFIDGLLIAVAFLTGEKTGKLMAIALLLEIAFLALSLSSDFVQRKKSLAFRSCAFIILSILVLVGTGSGLLILNYLPPAFFNQVLSFGVAALLYLVTEELLVEAHRIKDTPLIASSFFVGFLIILLLRD